MVLTLALKGLMTLGFATHLWSEFARPIAIWTTARLRRLRRVKPGDPEAKPK